MLRVLLLPDRTFATRERALLERLSVGLADEGVRVFQGVPGVGLDAEEVVAQRLGVFATPVPFADRGLPWTERLRAGALIDRLAAGRRRGVGALGGTSLADSSGDIGTDVVQVVHVFGTEMWELAWQTAQKSRAALVIEVFSRRCVEAAEAWGRRLGSREGANGGGAGPSVWYNAADPALAAALNRSMAGTKAALRISSNAWGVHVPEEPHSELDATRTGTLILWCGNGAKGTRDVAPLLEGLRSRAESPRGLLVLANEPTADRLGLWKLARSMDLSACLSVVPELTERWDLTLEADALVIPSAEGEQHGFVLDAMASGMPVVAKADDLASHLVDRETAVLVRDGDASSWRNAVSEVLDMPERAVALGSSARQFVREKRLASAWVAGVVAMYGRAVG
ncbi:MAG: glycosyltransferase [Phycisphaerales bacterium]